MGEGSANIWGVQVSGKDHEDTPFSYVFFSSGGTGARPVKDGLSATAFPSGVLGTPVEVIESLSPLLVERKSLRDRAEPAGSAGSGSDHRLPGADAGTGGLLDPLRPDVGSSAGVHGRRGPGPRGRC